jgi:hypothetical protein
MKTIQPNLESSRVRFSKYLVAVLVVVVLIAPIEAQAIGLGDIVPLIKTITDTLQNAVGGVLSEIQGVKTALSDYRQQIIWPVNELNQIRTFVGSTRTRYASLMSQIESINNNSATLPKPTQFELVLRGGEANGVDRFQALYTQVYANVPDVNAAAQIHRNMMDIDDALAVDALKTSVLSDQATAGILRLADSLEQQSVNAAPGSAPMLATQARLTDLVSQAQMEKVLAAELRQEAAKLAHQNALLKQSALAARSLQNQMQKVLKRP